jgi:hypothetical protein
MTIKELKAKISGMDDNSKITMQKSDGTQLDISKASQEGDHLTFFLDR